MKRLLAPINQPMLLQWLQDDTLFAFDYDGTLAPIVSDPNRAFMPRAIWCALAALSTTARVAVISGRSQMDLRRRLPAEVTYAIGNHGNEGPPVENPARRAEQTRICQSWLVQLQTQRTACTQWHRLTGAMIEDKGLSLSLHYRHCADHAQALALLMQFASQLTPAPQVIDGLNVINLLPPQAQTKREAMATLMAHSGAERGIFIGDDTTDEYVFASAPANWLTVRVGEAEQSQARNRLADPNEVGTLIEMAVKLRSPALFCTSGSAA